jgi:hypothetical protein
LRGRSIFSCWASLKTDDFAARQSSSLGGRFLSYDTYT